MRGANGDPNNRGQIPSAGLLQWHISHYAYLIDKLRNTPEGAGNVLDNSMIVFTAEAGHGLQLNDGSSQNQTHSVENMVMLLAGRVMHGYGFSASPPIMALRVSGMSLTLIMIAVTALGLLAHSVF